MKHNSSLYHSAAADLRSAAGSGNFTREQLAQVLRLRKNVALAFSLGDMFLAIEVMRPVDIVGPQACAVDHRRGRSSGIALPALPIAS
ncbi:MAG TPA: hypothetical protein VM659_27650, partial [Dongiaceae bacterium]|nr:hypothetical protein [Dongiaceae bacterium]